MNTSSTRQPTTSRDLALIATFAGLLVALAYVPKISLGITPVPITAQSLGVMLAGAILGWKRGGLAALLWFVIALVFPPALAGGRGGLSMLQLPTIGFIVGFIPGAMLTGALTEWGFKKFGLHVNSDSALATSRTFFMPVVIAVAAFIGGLVLVHLCGAVAFMQIKNIPLGKVLTLTSYPFIPGDLIKVALTALVATGLHKGYPGILPKPAQKNTTTPVG